MSSEEQGKLPESVTVGDAHPAAIIAGSAAVLVLVACGYHFFEKDVGLGRGENWRMHLLYWVIAVPIIVFVPATINQYIFSNLTQTVVGVALPIYESVRAVCTPEEEDDKMWLQYWMLGGIIFMLTTWVDDIIGSQLTTEYWYECMIFLFYWLYFPKTQGAVLVYNRLTKPFIAPLVRPVLGRMNNFIAYMYKLMVNAVHLWLLWFIFMFLPSGLQRMIAIAVGTVYPLVSSISAASTLEIQDDTYWLTYWSVYGVLFLIMDILETWIGWVPGFYTLVIFTSVYLMLPMFQGADKVFRNILVPLAGLQELLMLRDAIMVKADMLKNLPPHRAKSVRKAIAKFYDNDDMNSDSEVLKREMLSGWSGLKLFGGNGSGSSGSGNKQSATESTSLV